MSFEYRLVRIAVNHVVAHFDLHKEFTTDSFVLQRIGPTGVWTTCELVDFDTLPEAEKTEIKHYLRHSVLAGRITR